MFAHIAKAPPRVRPAADPRSVRAPAISAPENRYPAERLHDVRRPDQVEHDSSSRPTSSVQQPVIWQVQPWISVVDRSSGGKPARPVSWGHA